MSGLATGPSITPHEAKQLPIRKHAEEIVEAVKTNPTVIVLGETGSGKTTQISQVRGSKVAQCSAEQPGCAAREAGPHQRKARARTHARSPAFAANAKHCQH